MSETVLGKWAKLGVVFEGTPKEYYEKINKELENKYGGDIMFRVGDKVWNIDFGWGKVVDTSYQNNATLYPIRVEFECGHAYSFTKDGNQYKCGLRALFFEEIAIPESALKRPRWRANENKGYFYITSIGQVDCSCDSRDKIDDTRFEVGNYFKTRELAKESKYYKVFQRDFWDEILKEEE